MTTVRSQEKAQKIKDAHPKASKDKLDFVIVEDIAKEGAFDKAVKSEPPFEAVIHTASPFHFNVTDTKKDLLDPAIIGTTGILKAIKKNAPTVKKVVSSPVYPPSLLLLTPSFRSSPPRSLQSSTPTKGTGRTTYTLKKIGIQLPRRRLHRARLMVTGLPRPSPKKPLGNSLRRKS